MKRRMARGLREVGFKNPVETRNNNTLVPLDEPCNRPPTLTQTLRHVSQRVGRGAFAQNGGRQQVRQISWVLPLDTYICSRPTCGGAVRLLRGAVVRPRFVWEMHANCQHITRIKLSRSSLTYQQLTVCTVPRLQLCTVQRHAGRTLSDPLRVHVYSTADVILPQQR